MLFFIDCANLIKIYFAIWVINRTTGIVKILYFNNFYYPWDLGGAERSLRILVQGIRDRGYDVTVVSLAGEGRESFTGVVDGVQCYYIQDFNWGDSPTKKRRSWLGRITWQLSGEGGYSFRKELKRIFEKEAPDVVHTNNLGGVSAHVWGVASSLNIPVVHTLRGYYVLCSRGTMFKSGSTCATRCSGCKVLASRRLSGSSSVEAVVGNSEFILHRHLSLGAFKNAKIKTVIYSATDRLPTLARESANDGRVVFGFIGRLHPSKGLDWLFGALSKIEQKSFRLLVAGDGEAGYVDELKKKWVGMETQYVGWVSPEEFYPKIDLLVVPSLWHDPLPRVVYEAYSYGKPVIGANRGGITEAIVDGVTGWLFDPSNEVGFLNTVQGVLTNPKILDVLSARCLLEAEKFSLESCLDHYGDVYATLAEEEVHEQR